MAIQNPNSCGQGYDLFHKNNPYHAIAESFGYRYSHSTLIKMLDGSVETQYTYKHVADNQQNFSVTGYRWATSRPGSGIEYGCSSIEPLNRYLKSHVRRFIRKYGATK